MGRLSNKIIWYREQLQSSLTESWYIYCHEKIRLKEDSVLIQLAGGQTDSDGLLSLVRELRNQLKNSRIYIACNPETERQLRSFPDHMGMRNIECVEISSLKYWNLLATCKYLISDAAFHDRFIKRKGQLYLYAGFCKRPLTETGILDRETGYKSGNLQRNLLAADLILCPDKDTEKLIIRAFSLENLYKGCFLQIGGMNRKNLYQIICRVFLSNLPVTGSHKLIRDGRDNVYIFVDTLLKNGITASAFNLIQSLDLAKRNYFFVFRNPGAEANMDRLYELPEGVGVLALDQFDKTVSELGAAFLYYRFDIRSSIVKGAVDRCYKRNFTKYYGNVKQDCFIHFVGYGREVLNLYKQAPRKYVFVHNDMKRELEQKTIQHLPTIRDCYQNYTKVLGVSKKVTDIAKEIAGGKGTFDIVHNCFDYQNVLEKSKLPLTLETEANYVMEDTERFIDIVKDKNLVKFISIGRFSPEKKHLRLLDAFSMYWQDHRDTYLIIIGGYGSFYEATIDYAKKLPCFSHVMIIRSLRNPYNVLKHCGLFILSSSYEGVPVVFMEADCLGVPILSTDISGPKELLRFYNGGLLVEESADALYKGMITAGKTGINLLHIDFSEYNKKCVQQFEEIFI